MMKKVHQICSTTIERFDIQQNCHSSDSECQSRIEGFYVGLLSSDRYSFTFFLVGTIGVARGRALPVEMPPMIKMMTRSRVVSLISDILAYNSNNNIDDDQEAWILLKEYSSQVFHC